jgi:hypothetical protein
LAWLWVAVLLAAVKSEVRAFPAKSSTYLEGAVIEDILVATAARTQTVHFKERPEGPQVYCPKKQAAKI